MQPIKMKRLKTMWRKAMAQEKTEPFPELMSLRTWARCSGTFERIDALVSMFEEAHKNDDPVCEIEPLSPKVAKLVLK